ncbi:MAG: hypothetical protein V1816_03020 [Pseudomonadota bacterium]
MNSGTVSAMRHPFRWLLSLRKKEPELSEIRKAAERLDVGRLIGTGGPELTFDWTEILPEKSEPRLFGFYSASGVEYALRELGVFGKIEKLGFSDLKVVFQGDGWSQDMRIIGQASGREHLVMEGRFRRSSWRPDDDSPLWTALEETSFNVAMIEWFLLQNPLASFSPARPRLPGQKHPGLGLKDEIMSVFTVAARRLDLDAYLANAKLFHNAFMYSPMFFFLDGRLQAEMAAIKEAARDRPLQDISLAVEGGFLRRADLGETYQWTGRTMIRPLSKALLIAYHKSGYREEVERIAAGMRFVFDWEGFQAAKPDLVDKIIELQEDKALPSREPLLF